MLRSEEYDFVTCTLVERASLQVSPRQFLVAGLYPQLQALVGEGNPRFLVERVLAVSNDDGYRRSPPAMVHLLETLLPGDPDVAGIVERLRVPPPQPQDAFDALVLVSKLPFLERQATRTALRLFLHAIPTQPVVVVNGPQWTGKTYTGEFIDHVLSDRPGVRHCRIEIEKGQGGSIGPRELAKDMVTQMGSDPNAVPAENSNLDRWMQELANWVISVANASNRDWWFMLDGFNAAELRTSDTRLLIIKLAKSLTTGIARERHRLILADFDRSILTLQPGLIAAETIAAIRHTSVARAVAEVVRRSPEPLEAAKVTAKVLEGLGDPVDNLPMLGQRLSDLIVSVESPALAGG
jgi:hypothetical protein